MKAHVKVEQRILAKENRQLGVRNFDQDNVYPQRMKQLVATSGTAIACVELFAAFVAGDGLADLDFAKAVVNRVGLTMDDLNNLVADDISNHRGFAMIVNYNLNLTFAEVYHQPFAHCRLPDNDHLGKIAVYDNWNKERSPQIKKNQIKWFHVFDPRPEVVRQQIIAAGGITNYKGQILWISFDGPRVYPASQFDSVQEDIDIDAQDKTFRHSTVRKSFAPSVALISAGDYGDGNKDESDEQDGEEKREEFAKMIKQHQGAENVNSILHIELDTTEDIDKVLKIIAMPNVDNSKMYEGIRRSTKDNIIEAFGQPTILLGKEVSGKLGTSSEIKDAQDFYNAKTAKIRRRVERAYKMIFSNFAKPICPSGDYSIIPITLIKANDAVAYAQNQLRQTIGFWAQVQLLVTAVTTTGYPYDAAKAWMMQAGGISEFEAIGLLGPKPLPAAPPVPAPPPPTSAP